MTLAIRLPLNESIDVGDRFEVGWDKFTGTVDYDKPLNARPIEFYDAEEPHSGWLAGAWLAERFLDGPPDGAGFLEAPWLLGPWLRPVAAILWAIPDAVRGFGMAKFGVRTLDALGNVKAEAPIEQSILISTVPRAPRNVRFGSWDEVNGQVTLKCEDVA